MDDILKEAIADAKALRATALENAKIALEEAFTPRLKNMLSQKIQSEVEGEEDELGEDAYSENEVEDGMSQDDVDVDGERLAEDEDEMEDADAELPVGMEAEDGHEMEDADAHDLDGMEAEDGHEMQPEDEVPAELEAEDEEVPAELEAEDDETVDGDYVGEDEDEDELDLNSVIKELEEELDTSAVGDAENKEPSDDASDSSEIGAQGPEGEGADEEGGKENSDDEVIKEPVTEAENGDDKEELEEIDLEEVMKALSEEEAEDDKEGEVQEMKTQLKEYKDTIGFLREKLNEVTLLNAKLLFTNKLFRGFGLNNNQKLQVVEQFDRTKNLREIKLVYATLAESFKGNGNKRVNESKGQASKAVASTEPKKEVLSEGAEMRNRFKKLANLV